MTKKCAEGAFLSDFELWPQFCKSMPVNLGCIMHWRTQYADHANGCTLQSIRLCVFTAIDIAYGSQRQKYARMCVCVVPA